MPRIPDRSKYNIIRLAVHGCCNRPFYHLIVTKNRAPRNGPVQEILGSYDPLPNKFGEKHVAINIERLNHNLANGTQMTKTVEKMLGLSGLLPIHPMTYIDAHRVREGKEDKHPSALRQWKINAFDYFEQQKQEEEEKEEVQ